MTKLPLLLLEDSRPWALIVSRQLTFAAVTHADALDAIPADHGCVVALVDLGLPPYDGLETLEELRKLEPDLPLIAMTGSLPDTRLSEEILAVVDALVWKDDLDASAVRGAVEDVANARDTPATHRLREALEGLDG